MRASAVTVAPPVVTFQSAVARRVTYLEGDAALTLATSSTTVTEGTPASAIVSASVKIVNAMDGAKKLALPDEVDRVAKRVASRECAWDATDEALRVYHELFHDGKTQFLRAWADWLRHEQRGENALVDAILNGEPNVANTLIL